MFRQVDELDWGLATRHTRPSPRSIPVHGRSLVSTLRMYAYRPERLARATDLYAHRVTLLAGEELDLETLRGCPTLIVNTASRCGFTPQYAGLQNLYERYGERGLRLLGTPSADFADQEYEDAAEIGAFCLSTYGVSFPLTERMSVRARPSPLWSDLARQPNSGPPAWNFTKYLIGPDGRLIARWPTTTRPQSPRIMAAIEAVLPD
jgi:glutathione peroxidase